MKSLKFKIKKISFGNNRNWINLKKRNNQFNKKNNN